MALFGTDGVRGRAGEGVLSAQGTSRLAFCFGSTSDAPPGGGPLRVAVARDTRASGEMLRDACETGLHAAGAEVIDLGVLPTPGLSWLLAQRADLHAGIMLTASHNPWQDNGLKLFAGHGGKLSDALQERCERCYLDLPNGTLPGPDAGTTEDLHAEATALYLASLAETGAQGESLRGRKVVADGAAGAAWQVLPEALHAAGAQVCACAPEPDGRNINLGCGAVQPGAMAGRVVAEQAWAGVAVDGDGDRLVLADELGNIHDGDTVLGFLAAAMQDSGQLAGDRVVGTVTTGGGLEVFLRGLGLGLVRTAVGDRNVSAAMLAQGLNLGGESSGHVLTPDLCPSGDGTRVALVVLALAAASGRPLSEQLGVVPRFPAAQRQVRVSERPPLASLAVLQAEVARCESKITPLGGRLLLRYSGTEPVLRILVEGPHETLVEECADALAAAAGASLGEAQEEGR
jgi:phosphoglucosamine mutase